jgi:hypothetical protein
MTFEVDDMKVTQPLDTYQGPYFMDLVEGSIEEDTLDHLYTLTIGKKADHINTTADNLVIWHNIQYVGEDSEVAFEK